MIASLMLVCIEVPQQCRTTDLSCAEGVLLFAALQLRGATGPSRRTFTFAAATGNAQGAFGGAGAAAVDNGCAANLPPALAGTGVYKALVASNSAPIRVASLTANAGDGQIDWVLQANMHYFRADGSTLIGTTNAAALFEFPLTASFGQPGRLFTGLAQSWTTATFRCGDWTLTGGGVYVGDAGQTGAAAISDDGVIGFGCGTAAHFLCVQQ